MESLGLNGENKVSALPIRLAMIDQETALEGMLNNKEEPLNHLKDRTVKIKSKKWPKKGISFSLPRETLPVDLMYAKHWDQVTYKQKIEYLQDLALEDKRLVKKLNQTEVDGLALVLFKKGLGFETDKQDNNSLL